jgi:hypothetical protein
MAQQTKIGKHMTRVDYRPSDKRRFVRYWNTDVVQFDNQWITLDNGGFKTATTKLRMNQTAAEYQLGFSVYQKNFDWFVVTSGGQVIPWGIGERVSFHRSI